ncbi:conserved hypothetical protein [Pediculus humanus corporis]|uniref:Jumonji domain-containing protein 4 n=1 Tax=Pediculus humanus subsp. corporis TaxID=121224 RepID=E0VVM4_PEDHC|nr:uncharacterized protein Phum_PHUM465370 [Pediculus humanus corporis]EEB17430.1 conserved hypothetical protein [Pediculus humanus corporis]
MESAILEISNPDLIPAEITNDEDNIPLLDNNMNYTHFFQTYLLSNKPCLIKNMTDNWPCSSDWVKHKSLNVEYFRNRYTNIDVPVSNCGKREFNEFPYENVYRVPCYFASDWLNEYYDNNPDLKDDYRFVYIGPKNSWTPFHVDVFTSYSWSINITGKKRWILFPPGKEKFFMDQLGNLNYDIDLNKINIEKSKEFLFFDIIQEEGQGLFVPSGWHHQVWNLEDAISINHNWINGCNIHFIWNSLKKNLSDVKNEISDCKDMDNWSSQDIEKERKIFSGWNMAFW